MMFEAQRGLGFERVLSSTTSVFGDVQMPSLDKVVIVAVLTTNAAGLFFAVIARSKFFGALSITHVVFVLYVRNRILIYNEVQALKQENTTFRENNAAQKAQLAEQAAELGKFRKWGDEEIERRRRAVGELESQIQGLKETNAGLKETNAGLKETNAGLKETNAGLQATKDSLAQAVQEHKASLGASAESIARATATLATTVEK